MSIFDWIIDLFSQGRDQRYFNSGMSHMLHGDFSKATYEFMEAIKLKPTEEKYHDALGKALYKREMTTEANAPFGIADDLKEIKVKPQNMKVLCRLAMAFQDKRMFSVSQGYIQKALSIDPQNAQVHFLMGRAYYLGNNLKGAIEQYEKTLKLDHFCIDAYKGLGDVYSALGKKKKQSEFEEYLKYAKKVLESSNADSHAELGKVFGKYNKIGLAKKEFKKALQLNEKCEQAMLGMGVLEYNKGDIINSKQHFLSTIKINKYNSSAHSYLGLIYQSDPKTKKNAEWELALAKHLKELEMPKNHFKAFIHIGDFFFEGKLLEDAEEAYLRALKIESQNPEIYVKLGVLFANANKKKQAIDYCDQAIKLSPDKSIGHVGKGRVFLKINDLDKALTCFQEALKYSTKDPEIHGYLAEVYKSKGLYKLADKALRLRDSLKSQLEEVF